MPEAKDHLSDCEYRTFEIIRYQCALDRWDREPCTDPPPADFDPEKDDINGTCKDCGGEVCTDPECERKALVKEVEGEESEKMKGKHN